MGLYTKLLTVLGLVVVAVADLHPFETLLACYGIVVAQSGLTVAFIKSEPEVAHDHHGGEHGGEHDHHGGEHGGEHDHHGGEHGGEGHDAHHAGGGSGGGGGGLELSAVGGDATTPASDMDTLRGLQRRGVITLKELARIEARHLAASGPLAEASELAEPATEPRPIAPLPAAREPRGQPKPQRTQSFMEGFGLPEVPAFGFSLPGSTDGTQI